MLAFLKMVLRWIAGWVYYVAWICFGGAMIGIFSHLIFAFLFAERPDLFYYGSLGFCHGLQYVGVWAGGLSIVICVIKARREFLEEASKVKGSL